MPNGIPKKHTIPAFLLVLISTLIFSNTLKNDFMWDDKDLILENQYVKNIEQLPLVFIPKIRHHDLSGDKMRYRPLRELSFALDYLIWGDNPAGFHATNLFFHILNVLLIYFFITQLSRPPDGKGIIGVPFITAVFFAVYPIHTESVTWVKNRSDILALFFLLLSIILFIQYFSREDTRKKILSYAASLLCYMCALLSKEMALTLPLILVFMVYIFFPQHNRKNSVIKILPYIGLAAIFLFLYYVSYGTLTMSEHIPQLGFNQHVQIILKTIGIYINLLIFPINLNAERTLSFPNSFFEPEIFLGGMGIVLIPIICFKLWKHSKALVFGLVWIVITLIPVSNIIFLVGRPIAEQRLYFASLGICLILAICTVAIRSKKFSALVATLILIFFSLITIQRNADWRDPITFWTKTAMASPDSARTYANLGKSYDLAGNKSKALEYYQESITIDPNIAKTHRNLADTYAAIGKIQNAVESYKRAIALNPLYAQAYNNLGKVYIENEKREEAVSLFRKAIEIQPDYMDAYYNLGLALEHQGMDNEATLIYQKALQVAPGNSNMFYRLALIELKRGRQDNAQSLLEKVITGDPAHGNAYYHLGLIYRANSKFDDAIAMFEQALSIKPQAHIYNEISAVYFSMGRINEAMEVLKKAQEITAKQE